jgi:cytochrome c oxidase cbb3-type subunit 3
VPGSIVDPSYLSLMSNQALRSVVVAGRNDLGMPDYRNALRGRVMSHEQIADVVAWLVDHRVEFPGQPFTSKEKNDG